MNDIVMILVYTFPMFLFTVYPGIWLSDFAEENYGVSEKIKRTIMVSITLLGAIFLGSLLHYV